MELKLLYCPFRALINLNYIPNALRWAKLYQAFSLNKFGYK